MLEAERTLICFYEQISLSYPSEFFLCKLCVNFANNLVTIFLYIKFCHVCVRMFNRDKSYGRNVAVLSIVIRKLLHIFFDQNIFIYDIILYLCVCIRVCNFALGFTLSIFHHDLSFIVNILERVDVERAK